MFRENNFPFFTTNKRRQKMYWEGNVKMPSSENSPLRESLQPQPIIVLITLFCNRNTFELEGDCPQNITPYDIMA